MQRIALGIEYHGANYFGWQRQLKQPSIQSYIEKAVSLVANHSVIVSCAGRTDAGVHACGQVVHFDSQVLRSDHAWIRGANANLPQDIRVLWSKKVTTEFDARRSALSRRYCYIIANRSVRPGIFSQAVTWVRPILDILPMQKAATYLLGEHDFTSFRGSQCQARTPIRSIYSINITQRAENIILDITANAFLHHMVRNIAGTLISIGNKKQPPEWMQLVLQAKQRSSAGITAPPEGLYLAQVNYPTVFDIPAACKLPWFL